jgi:hypothetical protein
MANEEHAQAFVKDIVKYIRKITKQTTAPMKEIVLVRMRCLNGKIEWGVAYGLDFKGWTPFSFALEATTDMVSGLKDVGVSHAALLTQTADWDSETGMQWDRSWVGSIDDLLDHLSKEEA